MPLHYPSVANLTEKLECILQFRTEAVKAARQCRGAAFTPLRFASTNGVRISPTTRDFAR